MRNFKDSKFEKRDSKPKSFSSERSNVRTPKRYEKSAGGRPSGRDFAKPQYEMHRAVCDKCGESCQVPFKPSQDKPVFCSNCFRKGDNNESFSPRRSESRSEFSKSEYRSDISRKDFDQLNMKLDKILEILNAD